VRADRRRVALRIKGRVQGVFFRDSTRQQAVRLGITGWVRNIPGGDVEALAEGPAEALEAWVRWCHRGPPAAKVDAVERTDSEPTGEFADFSVRR
jgi:acylphosphatase